MKYFAARRSFLLESPAVDASCAAIGAWFRLQSYATSDEVENPRMAGARNWSSRRWGTLQLKVADVSRAVEAGLAAWDGDDLLVEVGFDRGGLDQLLGKRLTAQQNGRHGGRPKVAEIIDTAEPTLEPTLKPTPNLLRSDLISSPLTPSASGDESAERRGPEVPKYHPDFEAIWLAVGRVGSKFEAHRDWTAVGRPLVAEVDAGWKRYLASIESWRSPQHACRWFKARGWLEAYDALPIARPGANGSARNGHTHDVRVGHTMADGQVHKGGGVVKDF